MENLVIRLNGREFKVVLDKTEKSMVVINDKPYNVELIKTYSENIFSFTVNQRLVQIALDLRNNGNSFIIADGFVHEIEITDETKHLLEKFIQQNTSINGSSNAKIKAPMPGMVIKVLIEAGSRVKKGDKIIIIEAMKMENSISSPIDGIIKSLYVKEGTAVDKDTLMVEIEAS